MSKWRLFWRPGSAAPDREHEGPDPETLGRGANAGNERRGVGRQDDDPLYLPIALLARRRTWPTAFSRADVFPPGAKRSLDDLATRPHGAPHLSHRQALGKSEAVLVRRIDRPLPRGRARGRYDRARGRRVSLHRFIPHAAY